MAFLTQGLYLDAGPCCEREADTVSYSEIAGVRKGPDRENTGGVRLC